MRFPTRVDQTIADESEQQRCTLARTENAGQWSTSDRKCSLQPTWVQGPRARLLQIVQYGKYAPKNVRIQAESPSAQPESAPVSPIQPKKFPRSSAAVFGGTHKGRFDCLKQGSHNYMDPDVASDINMGMSGERRGKKATTNNLNTTMSPLPSTSQQVGILGQSNAHLPLSDDTTFILTPSIFQLQSDPGFHLPSTNSQTFSKATQLSDWLMRV